MGKYLHRYTSKSDFTRDYNDDEAIGSFTCDLGIFIYSNYEEDAYVWKNNENYILITIDRTPKVGAWNPMNGTGAWDPDDEAGIDITAVGPKVPGKYIEPWVSLTKYTQTESLHVDSVIDAGALAWENVDLEYVGLVDYYISDLA